MTRGARSRAPPAFHEEKAGELRTWLSVASDKDNQRRTVELAVRAGQLVMLEGARVVGSAPVDAITAVTVHETLVPSYEARLELQTRRATLKVWRDAAAENREQENGTTSSSEAAVAALLAALGCPVAASAASLKTRLGLGTRVRTFKSDMPSGGLPSPDARGSGSSTPTEDMFATTCEDVITTRRRWGSQPQLPVRSGKVIENTRPKSITLGTSIPTKDEEDASFERLRIRADWRWGNHNNNNNNKRSASIDESSSTKSSRTVYRGSWLAPVDDTGREKPPFTPPSSPTASARSEASSCLSSTRRERYRDALASATESAKKKVSDVSRAALSVHADAERLCAQLSTSDCSRAELESTLSLAADGAKEARTRLAALEKEVAMLAGPTLRELAWATQLRRTADARLARDLASDWPRQGWVRVRRYPQSVPPTSTFVARSETWNKRVWLQVVESDETPSPSINRDMSPTAAAAAAVMLAPAKLVARVSDEPGSPEVCSFEITSAVELRRCQDHGAPAFALELVPKAPAMWLSNLLANYFFDAFATPASTNGFAFAPESADDQRCWSLTLDAMLKEAAVACAIAAGDTRDEADDAPAAAEPVRNDALTEVTHRPSISEEVVDPLQSECAVLVNPPDVESVNDSLPQRDGATSSVNSPHTATHSLADAVRPVSKLEAFKRTIAEAVEHRNPLNDSATTVVPSSQLKPGPKIAQFHVSQLSLLDREREVRAEAKKIAESRPLEPIVRRSLARRSKTRANDAKPRRRVDNLRENKRETQEILVVKRSRGSDKAVAPGSAAADMIHELERGAIIAFRFVPGTRHETERYEFECIDAFEFVDDETLAPLLQSRTRPTLAKLYSAWRSDYSIKTDHAEFRSELASYMTSQSRRWLASCTLLEVERPDETCVVLFRLHDDPHEYVQPIKFGDVLVNWAPKRDDGSMSFADRATSNAVVVANLAKWLDANRVTAQRTLRVDTASADQSDGAPLHYERVYRKLFQKAIVL